MKTADTTHQISERAMLVKLRVSTWEARRHDKKVTEAIHAAYSSSSEAGRYHKRLFGRKIESHQLVLNNSMYLRDVHYEHTLPWEDQGWRLLPMKNYWEYQSAIRGATDKMEQALESFLDEYPDLIRQARDILNGMFREEDYPTASEVRAKFGSSVDFQPVPAGSDFRVGLPETELSKVREATEARIRQSLREAVEDVWTRLEEGVSYLEERLHDGKYLRASMIDKIRDLGTSVERLNILDDPELEGIRTRVLADLGSLSIDELRQNDDVREDARAKAEDILNTMRGLYG